MRFGALVLGISVLCACGGRAVIDGSGTEPGNPGGARTISAQGGGTIAASGVGGAAASSGTPGAGTTGASGTTSTTTTTSCPPESSPPEAYFAVIGEPCAPYGISCVSGPVACACMPPANHTDLEWDCFVLPSLESIGCPGDPPTEAALNAISGFTCPTLGASCVGRPSNCGDISSCTCTAQQGLPQRWACSALECK